MDYSKVFGVPASVQEWVAALKLPGDISTKLEALGFSTLFSCAHLEESDVKELNIQLPGHRRTLLAGSEQLRQTLERIKSKVVAAETLPEISEASVAVPARTASRTPICNSAIPRGVAPDYWDRARNKDRFEHRVKSNDGICVLLVRHAQSLANVDMKYYTTHADYSIPLSELGLHQAAESGRQIAAFYRKRHGLVSDAPPPPGWHCRIWTSPYVRARQTSKLLMENADGWITDISENVMLVEQNFGLFEGVDWYSGELDDKYPNELHHYQKAAAFGGRYFAQIPLGESRFQVCLRVSQCFPTIHRDVARCNIKNVIVVSHGTTLRAFTMMWLRLLPEWFEEEPNPANASIRVIDDYHDEGYIWPKPVKEDPNVPLDKTMNDDALLKTPMTLSTSSMPPPPEEPDLRRVASIKIQSPTGEVMTQTAEPSSHAASSSNASHADQSHSSAPSTPHHLSHSAHSPATPSSRSLRQSRSQYGGSEDALLKSSASAHPVNQLSL